MSFLLKAKQFVKREKGQAGAEGAIVFILLIFMVIGLFEVGNVLVKYLQLAQSNRVGTRFSLRANVMDFSNPTEEIEGYTHIINHMLTSNAGQLDLQEEFNNTINGDETQAAVMIHHIVVDTGTPGVLADKNDVSECEGGPTYDLNDMILYKGVNGSTAYDHLQFTYPDPEASSAVIESQLDIDTLVKDLVKQNIDFNCKLLEKGGTDFSDNSVMIVESFYGVDQLTGLLPVIPNPIPLTSQTMMRITSNATGRCEVLPIATHVSVIQAMQAKGGEDDLLEGNFEESGGFGWLAWNPGKVSNTYLEEELTNPRLSTNDFEDALEAGDTELNVGDSIASLTGVKNSDSTRVAMTALMGQTVLIPIYDYTNGKGSGASYHVHSFARVRIGESSLPPGQGGSINATVIEWPADDACPGNGK